MMDTKTGANVGQLRWPEVAHCRSNPYRIWMDCLHLKLWETIFTLIEFENTIISLASSFPKLWPKRWDFDVFQKYVSKYFTGIIVVIIK
jgi:hypothetical protein